MLRKLPYLFFTFSLLSNWLFPQNTGFSWYVAHECFIEAAPQVPEVHASTITEAADRSLVAAWFGGSREGAEDISIWVSRNVRGNWQPACIVAEGIEADGKRYPTWNPVLHTARNGNIYLFYKVGPSPQEWWGKVIVSTDNGRTWGSPQNLPKNILGPIKNKAILLKDGVLLCPSSIEHKNKVWQVRMERTDEALRNWTQTEPIEDPGKKLNAIQPSILLHPDGRLQALCRTKARCLAQTWSTDNGKTWSPLEKTGLYMPNSGMDAVNVRQGGFLLVYNPSSKVEAEKSKTWGKRWPIVVAHSNDGIHWKEILSLDKQPNRQGYAYPAIIQSRDGRVHITYTWNRARIKHIILQKDTE